MYVCMYVHVYSIFSSLIEGVGRCTNNGTCFDGYCSCPYGYNGQFCQIGM